jgi:hypothetical protein
LAQLGEVVNIYKIDEVIFANKGMSTSEILDVMSGLQMPALRYKIVPPDADYLVGPNIIHASLSSRGAIYRLEMPDLKFQKRLFDLGLSLLLTLIFPLTFWRYPNPGLALGNLLKVLGGKKHLVGYIESKPNGLPNIKDGVLNMLHRVKGSGSNSGDHSKRLDQLYARTYSPELDLEILLKGMRNLGVRP